MRFIAPFDFLNADSPEFDPDVAEAFANPYDEMLDEARVYEQSFEDPTSVDFDPIAVDSCDGVSLAAVVADAMRIRAKAPELDAARRALLDAEDRRLLCLFTDAEVAIAS